MMVCSLFDVKKPMCLFSLHSDEWTNQLEEAQLSLPEYIKFNTNADLLTENGKRCEQKLHIHTVCHTPYV